MYGETMRNTIKINENWLFAMDCAEISAIPQNAENINLPHTWNAVDGQDGGNDYFRGSCTYFKSFAKADLPAADRYYIEINGANSSAQLFVNDEKLAEHHGGYSTWRADITENLKEENTVAVVVDNAANETVYPQTADFTFYGGIYRDVNIICVNESHFNLDYYGAPGIKITPVVDGKNATVEVEVFTTDTKENQQLVYILKGKCGCEIERKTVPAGETKVVFEIKDVHLWQGVKDPYLYIMDVQLVEDGNVLDNVTTKFGCRTFKIDPENGFILNGEEYPLRGVSRHQDRWGKGNALSKEDHDEDMALICEMGANTIRLAHYQHVQYFYDLCDEKGMVLWAEIPYISRHMPDGRENTVSQMKELIVQNYNHPSIVVWGLSNEITMDGAKDPDLIENHKILNDLCHEMDKTRPTVVAVISMCGIDEEYVHIPDVVSYNHYFGWYGGTVSEYGPWFDNFHKKYPNTAIGVSEYGCEALNWHTSNPESGDYTEEYQAYYHEELIKQLFTRKYLWATHVWNMFDFGADARNEGGENGQNHKGLVTIDRKYKKDSFYAYKAWLSDEPFVHICGKRYVDRVEEITKVTVYSNQPEVELFANGVSLGKQTSDVHFFYFDVPNTAEITQLKAVAGECTDASEIHKVEKFNQDYILREKGAVLNWFDVTEIEGRFSLNDKLGDITKTLRGKIWFMGLFLVLAKKQSGPNAQKKPKDKKKKSKGSTPKADSNLMNMIGNFTVLRFTSMLGMRNVTFTKEELLDINIKLNKIRKPKA